MSDPATASARVHLRLMTEDEFAAWQPQSIAGFSAELARATGRPLEAARARAAGQYDELLPDGRATEGHWLFVVVDEAGASVGTLWLGPHPQRPEAAFVYELEIAESHRRRGYGRAAMLAGETVLLDAGIAEIGLNVFGFNHGAKRLYEQIGYDTVSTQMRKVIDALGGP